MTNATRSGPARSADEVAGAVRVHIDRVHDAVRRLGCGPAAAVEVVEHSAMELVETVARRPATVPDLIGWWMSRARELGCRVVDEGRNAPVGGGVLARDEQQRKLVRALERLPEPERVAVLLRDAYALGLPSVAAALHTTPEVAGERVAAGRLHLLPLMEDAPVPAVPTHAAELAVLGRLSEAGPVAASDATARRHVQSCDDCRAVVEAQEHASALLAGLAVVAMPAGERTAVLDRVHTAASELLPAVVTREPPQPPAQRRPPVISFSMVMLVVVAALLVGAVIGVLLAPN